MDGFGHQLATEAAEAEGCSPQRTEGSSTEGSGLASMFGFATQWGKKLQSELQLTEFVTEFKKQSSEVSKAYSQDLAEFAQIVKTGASRGLDELSHKFTQLNTSGQTDMLKQNQQRAQRILSRLGSDLEDLLRDAIVIEAPGSNSTEEQKKEARKIIYDRKMAQLAQKAEDKATFLGKVEDTEEYRRFIEVFDLKDKNEEIERLLVDGSIRNMYQELVPKEVTHEVFWTRYFYHTWLIEQEEIRRKKLVEAAVAATAEDEFSWDMDDEEKDSSSNEQTAGTKPEDKAEDKAGAKTEDKTEKTDIKVENKTEDKPEPQEPNADTPATETKHNNKQDGESTGKQNEHQPDTAASKPSDADAWDEWE
ncbi:hypothetical protein IWW36_001116 [Coemansia brasiliensis]|uniref:BSD domain-containing protein n=1 Tax=Coemansia brasiliensis TaxID=2650707 RepID=A0A9W8IEL7_9FUNG|nr:hypothetical protein IWW36_001116 [Coemansia brasiliensis]